MLKKERHRLILAELHERGKVVSTELSLILNISVDTVRRDLHELANAGHIVKVHGGALPLSQSANDIEQQGMSLVAQGLELLFSNQTSPLAKLLVINLNIQPK